MEGPGAPTKAEDVYAFGSTLYTVRYRPASIPLLFPSEAHETYLKAFTGVAPFEGRYRRLETAMVEIGLHGHWRLPQPDSISNGLWEIIRCCWEYDPAARPDMECVVGALNNCLHS